MHAFTSTSQADLCFTITVFLFYVLPESRFSLEGRSQPIFKKGKRQLFFSLLILMNRIFTNSSYLPIAVEHLQRCFLTFTQNNRPTFTVECTYFCPLCLRGTEFCLGVLSQAPSVLSLASLLFKGWFFHGITYPGVGLNCFKSPCPNELRSPQ